MSSSMSKLDLDFYEQVIIYNILTNETYLASIVDNLAAKYFNNISIRSVIDIIKDFHTTRDAIPTLTEIKAYLTTEEAKDNFRNVVDMIKNFDQRFNDEELYDNTERFLKEKAVMTTLMAVAKDCESGDVDTSDVLTKF